MMASDVGAVVVELFSAVGAGLRFGFLDDELQMDDQEIGCVGGCRLGHVCELSEVGRSNISGTSVLAKLRRSELLRTMELF